MWTQRASARATALPLAVPGLCLCVPVQDMSCLPPCPPCLDTRTRRRHRLRIKAPMARCLTVFLFCGANAPTWRTFTTRNSRWSQPAATLWDSLAYLTARRHAAASPGTACVTLLSTAGFHPIYPSSPLIDPLCLLRCSRNFHNGSHHMTAASRQLRAECVEQRRRPTHAHARTHAGHGGPNAADYIARNLFINLLAHAHFNTDINKALGACCRAVNEAVSHVHDGMLQHSHEEHSVGLVQRACACAAPSPASYVNALQWNHSRALTSSTWSMARAACRMTGACCCLSSRPAAVLCGTAAATPHNLPHAIAALLLLPPPLCLHCRGPRTVALRSQPLS